MNAPSSRPTPNDAPRSRDGASPLERSPVDAARAAFADHFGASPEVVVRAPGRVNLIGGHTDYNDGFVLPLAIDRAVAIALRPRGDRRVRVVSLDFGEETTFDVDALDHDGPGWAEYLKGSAWALAEVGGTLAGWEGVVTGDVPRGAGLSSSAALELATLRAFHAVTGAAWDPASMARVGQRAENGWVGMNCGIMDQMISAAGEPGHALLIDCRTLATEAVPLPAGTVTVVLDTATRRGLVGSAYNERRAACEAAAAAFGVPALRDLPLAELEAGRDRLDATVYRRARHVVTENARTLEAAAAMRAGDAVRLGALVSASHASLRDDFEVSSEALDLIVEFAHTTVGCYGARMTGAGFGGCAVALVDEAATSRFVEAVALAYEAATGRTPALYVTPATAGAAVLPGTADDAHD